MANSIYEPLPIVSTRLHEVNLLDPDPATINLNEIATSLARVTRYSGHSTKNVSVLAHTFICDRYLRDMMHIDDPLIRLAVLLHDAHEAYVGDTVRPLKREINRRSAGFLTTLENGLDRAIWRSLGLDMALVTEDIKAIVKEADNAALAIEVQTAWPELKASGRWGGLEDYPEFPQEALRIAYSDIWSVNKGGHAMKIYYVREIHKCVEAMEINNG